MYPPPPSGELEKAERGIAMDAENVARLRSMLRQARKQKLFAGLSERGGEGAANSLTIHCA